MEEQKLETDSLSFRLSITQNCNEREVQVALQVADAFSGKTAARHTGATSIRFSLFSWP